MDVFAVRGAIQLEEDNEEQIKEKTERLVTGLMQINMIGEDDIISLQFTQTADIRALNAATALRTAGYAEVPLFCSQEPECSGGLPLMIRVLLTYRSSNGSKPSHLYLDGAEALRPDR